MLCVAVVAFVIAYSDVNLWLESYIYCPPECFPSNVV